MIRKKDRVFIERYALSLLLNEKGVWAKYGPILKQKAFNNNARRLVFRLLHMHGGTLTYKTFEHELRKRSSAIDGQLAVQCQNAFLDAKKFKYEKDEAEFVIKSLIRFMSTDKTFEWMKQYIELIEQGEIERAEEFKYKHLFKGVGSAENMGIDRGEISEDLESRQNLMKDMIANPDKYKLCKTGIKKLDKVIGGFSKGEFILLAAHTSRGKSTIALNIAYKNHIRGKKVLYFVNEFPKLQAQRIYDSIATRIPYKKFKFADLSRKEFKIWDRKIRNLKKFGGSFHVISLSSNCSANVIREMVKMYGDVDLVIVDSILYMDDDRGSFGGAGGENGLGNISRDLKGIAMEFQVPVLALTQLTVESVEKEQLDYYDIGYCRKMSFIADMILGIPGIQSDDEGIIIQLVKNRDGDRNSFVKIYTDWSTRKILNVRETEKEDRGESSEGFED